MLEMEKKAVSLKISVIFISNFDKLIAKLRKKEQIQITNIRNQRDYSAIKKEQI